ncbi:MAG: cell surface protein SprA, partial [Candidatus Krumholzibacteria bacterium]|nr:cell surface protein SprA [Candidatus Krumholzibacteria bacterium]
MQSANRVRINYTGFDDDIIKLIEMGDTDLILSGAQLISYSGTAKGLFGVKVMAQIGPADLTVIASKEEGETATGTFTSQGGQATESRISDHNYIKREFFFLGYPGDDFENLDPNLEMYPYPVIGTPANDMVEVFISLRKETEWGQTGEYEYTFFAYADPENNGIEDNVDMGDKPWSGRFRRLKEDEFELIQSYTGSDTTVKYVGLHLLRRLDKDRALAVIYKAKRWDDRPPIEIGEYGKFRSGLDSLNVALICPTNNEFAPDSPTWKMMMRNVYSLGMGGVSEEGLAIWVEREENRANPDIHIADSSGVSYLRIFGLDRYIKGSTTKEPDGLVDDLPGILNLERGYLMFPWHEPFDSPEWVIEQFIDTTNYKERKFDYSTLELADRIYSATTELERSKGHLYNIVVVAEGSGRAFQLNAFDIIEGSEVVTVDGEKLVRGVDYTIDYMSGTVNLKGDKIYEMTPDSKVSIDYQHKPFVGGGRSSLLGVGANFHLSQNSRINATFLYNSEGAPKYNPRLGEEPSRTMAADLNGTFQFNPRWMTSLVNLLPRVDTDNESGLNLGAEVAVSIPNPNVKGEAFIDDMEGIEDSDVLNMLRRSWSEASPPIDPYDMDNTLPSLDSLKLDFFWYNAARTPQQEYLITSKRDLNPRLDERENSAVSSLFINAYKPDVGVWCGVMTGFPGGGLDLSNTQYVEIWVNDFQIDRDNRGGILHIDFGDIDEDFHNPELGELDDEDRYPYTWTIEEDTGFDGDDPGRHYPSALEESTWDDTLGIYRWINSRIGNILHDTEDLNRSGFLDEINNYYSLELNLADSALIDVRRDFPENLYHGYYNESAANKTKAWRMYRLDLSKTENFPPDLSQPRLDAVQHMRVWIENVDGMEGARGNLLEIAGLKFVGNRWEEDGIRDLDNNLFDPSPPGMEIKIGTINNKDNPSLYSPPYQVQKEEGIQNREQLLLFEFENFDSLSSFRAVKRFFGSGQDYQQYRELQFFIRAHDITEDDSCSFFLQVAYDSMNYYEVEVPLVNPDKWFWITINFSDLTNLKISAAGGLVEETITDALDLSRTYTARLLGNPTLFQVRYLFAGLRNRGTEVISEGGVWFNDLKLGGVRRDIDHAERASFSANFANIVQISGNWQRTGPEFRSLRQKRGSGVTRSGLSFSGKSKINHFVPTGRFEFPVSVKYNSSKSLPKYLPQSDVEITEPALRDSLRSLNRSYSFNVSMSRRGSENFFMKHLFDNLKSSFSYSKQGVFSPNTRDTTWTMSGNLNYQVNFRKTRQLGLIKGIKWRYWLSNFNFTSSGSRKTRSSYSLSAGEFIKRPSTYNAGMNSSLSTLYEPFGSVKIDFNMNEKRNLGVDHDFHGIPIGIQTNFGHSMKMNFQPKGQFFILSQFSPRFEYSSRYSEDLRPSIRQADDPFGTRNVGLQRGMNFVFDVDIGKYSIDFGELLNLFKEGEAGKGSRQRSSAGAVRRESNDFKERMKRFEEPQKGEKAGKVESIFGSGKSQPGAGSKPPSPTQPSTGFPGVETKPA